MNSAGIVSFPLPESSHHAYVCKPPLTDLGATDKQSIIGIIPARWGSSRFPGKPLHRLAGKFLVQHVYERALNCQSLKAVFIATDDDRIKEAALEFGAQVIMTREDHPTGTDRIAEAAQKAKEENSEHDFTHIINIQGDEPLIDPAVIDELGEALLADESLSMGTAASPLEEVALYQDPNVVKLVMNLQHEALYFSRSPLPFFREGDIGVADSAPVYRHIGLYGYRADFLNDFVSWPMSILEQAESLEQLRALENGHKIKVILTADPAPGVDTLEQALEVEQLILSQTTSHTQQAS